MAQYDFTWKVTDYDANTGICTVVYTPKDKKLDELTSTLKVTNIDELANVIIFSAPVHDWHRQEQKVDANTILSLTGSGSAEV